MRIDLRESVSTIKQFRRALRSDNRLVANHARTLVMSIVEGVTAELARAAGVEVTVRIAKPSRATRTPKRKRRARRVAKSTKSDA